MFFFNFFFQISSQSSNLLNQARLKVLQAQQQHIQNLLAESRTRLGKSSSDRANYTRVVCDLIIQALFQVYPFWRKQKLIFCHKFIPFSRLWSPTWLFVAVKLIWNWYKVYCPRLLQNTLRLCTNHATSPSLQKTFFRPTRNIWTCSF